MPLLTLTPTYHCVWMNLYETLKSLYNLNFCLFPHKYITINLDHLHTPFSWHIHKKNWGCTYEPTARNHTEFLCSLQTLFHQHLLLPELVLLASLPSEKLEQNFDYDTVLCWIMFSNFSVYSMLSKSVKLNYLFTKYITCSKINWS